MTAPARCPKCDAARADDAACPRCGLSAAHAAAWQQRAALAPTASLEAAWLACEAAWTDDAAHERAAAAALATNDFGWLAGRYRAVLRERPDDAVAPARLAIMARRAQATLLATATPARPAQARKFPVVAVIVAVAAVAGTALYAAYLAHQQQRGTGRSRPVEPIRAPTRTLPEPTIEPAPRQR